MPTQSHPAVAPAHPPAPPPAPGDALPPACADALLGLAAVALETPLAALFLCLPGDRLELLRPYGFMPGTPAGPYAMAAHVAATQSELLVSNASTDECFRMDPLVSASPRARFCAGCPIVAPGTRTSLGVLLVMDPGARDESDPAYLLALRAHAQAVAQVLVNHTALSRRVAALQGTVGKLLSDLQHPLQDILAAAVSLQSQAKLSPTDRSTVQAIATKAEFGLAVIEDGTGPGRNNAGRPGVKCDLRLCVEAALEEAAPAVRYQLDHDLEVEADAAQLRALLVQLLGCVPLAPDEVERRLAVEAPGAGASARPTEIRFRVSAVGAPGAPPLHGGALWETYSTSLTACQRLARLLGGTLSAAAAPDHGGFSLTCTVLLPSRRPADLDLAAKRVLVVSDAAAPEAAHLLQQCKSFGLTAVLASSDSLVDSPDPGEQYDAAVVASSSLMAVVNHWQPALPCVVAVDTAATGGAALPSTPPRPLRPSTLRRRLQQLWADLPASAGDTERLRKGRCWNVAVLEDDAVSRAALVGCLKRRGCQPSTLRLTEDAAAQPAAYRQHDIVIIDAATYSPRAAAVRRALEGQSPAPYLIATKSPELREDDHTRHLCKEADAVLEKPVRYSTLCHALQRLELALSASRSQTSSSGGFLSPSSAAMTSAAGSVRGSPPISPSEINRGTGPTHVYSPQNSPEGGMAGRLLARPTSYPRGRAISAEVPCPPPAPPPAFETAPRSSSSPPTPVSRTPLSISLEADTEAALTTSKSADLAATPLSPSYCFPPESPRDRSAAYASVEGHSGALSPLDTKWGNSPSGVRRGGLFENTAAATVAKGTKWYKFSLLSSRNR